MAEASLYFVYLVITMAFIFDFINGFHDASNSIATIVATGVLKPRLAVCWAAFFNFIAFLFFHLSVAKTIGTGVIDTSTINTYTIFAALISAILFNLLTWYLALPSSSSHALIGGIIGASVASAGWQSLHCLGIAKIFAAIIISPLLGWFIAYSYIHLAKKTLPNNGAKLWPKHLQLVSSALLSLGHGGNDAQKTMGIIALVLYSNHLLGAHFYVPIWVVVSCNLIMALGTLAGGWRIVSTLAYRITHLEPLSGSCAETAAACTLFTANYFGIPISTTHTVTGAIVGVSTRDDDANNRQLLKRIAWAWLTTIPITACISAGITSLRYLF